ncbi:hypothetical protein P343_12375 [Sporolactobacillus laevolacticus DSM 442]|uniref:Uncharacterized protein n=1 Tax=Sporolactobacillus laevolacticus DSM 442 TaxID=1395513 RepID=V6J3W2_9BACL|nr:hypothetical protein P343_12375 [Sporolactobacillus laevolacticus DSM 442]
MQKKTYSHCNRTHAQPFGAAKQILSGRIKSCIWQKLVDGFLEKKLERILFPLEFFVETTFWDSLVLNRNHSLT